MCLGLLFFAAFSLTFGAPLLLHTISIIDNPEE